MRFLSAKVTPTGLWLATLNDDSSAYGGFGGTDRSEASMNLFYQWLGPKKTKHIRLARDGYVESV